MSSFFSSSNKEKIAEKITFNEFKEFFIKNNLFYDETILKILFFKLFYSKRKTFLLEGPAGTGKTTLAEKVAEFINAKKIFYQCTVATQEDDFLYKYIPSENTASGIKIVKGVLVHAAEMSQKEKIVLIIDEFDKTRPTTDAFLLDFLQNYRLSVYLDNKKTIIRANPDNLIIFLTSNKMRELSEPLIRRLTRIELKPLKTEVVFKILSSRFNKELAILLTQIYEDTINANLTKPATIQELIELGEILERDTSLSLNELVKMFIVKYDDDYEKFIEYIKDRKPFDFVKENKEENRIEKYYEVDTSSSSSITNLLNKDNENENKNDDNKLQEILDKLSKIIVVNKINDKIEPLEEPEKEIQAYFKVEFNEHNYDIIMKELFDEIDINSKAEIINLRDNRKIKIQYDTDGKKYIISEDKFSLRELFTVMKKVRGEYFIDEEDTFLVSTSDIKRLLDECKVKYIAKNTIIFKYKDCNDCDDETIIKMKIVKDFDIVKLVKLQIYVKGLMKLNSLEEIIFNTIDFEFDYGEKELLEEKGIENFAQNIQKILEAVFLNYKNATIEIFTDSIGNYLAFNTRTTGEKIKLRIYSKRNVNIEISIHFDMSIDYTDYMRIKEKARKILPETIAIANYKDVVERIKQFIKTILEKKREYLENKKKEQENKTSS